MKNNKNKEGIANLLLFIGSIMVLMGIVLGLVDFDLYVKKSFFICLIGTIMTFISNYLRNGYLKFFN